jgi:hypothetical protein
MDVYARATGPEAPGPAARTQVVDGRGTVQW